ncbi:MAG: FecR domain-containing protein [Tannerellaceae bacterium]|jgi:ferric-dicitrate binding protein FerR (iron transport regulator)|nr:FecR domain-containing protein [Tannerellaceae bacterium]
MDKESWLHTVERYLQGKATEEETGRLQAFLEKDRRLSEWMENRLASASEALDADTRARMLANIRRQTGYAPPACGDGKVCKVRVYLRRVSIVAALAAFLAIWLGAYVYLNVQETAAFEVAAAKGEKASLTLPEGSTVALNSDSKIICRADFNRRDRALTLEGEAYFDVTHNPEKPFIVTCEQISVRVLGTRFGIKTYGNEDHISIVLNAGKIRLTTPKETIEMKPDDRIVYNKRTQTAICEKVNADDYTGWRQNRLRFENESLETIVKSVSRMHNIDIEFDRPQLKDLRFTGTIDNTNIESVLDAIKLTSLLNYRLEDGVVYLYKPDSGGVLLPFTHRAGGRRSKARAPRPQACFARNNP